MLYNIFVVIIYNKIGVNSRKYINHYNYLIISYLNSVFFTLWRFYVSLC